MPLDPVSEIMLAQLATQPPLHTRSIAEARQSMIDMANSMPPGEVVARTQDRKIPGPDSDIPIRIYWPSEAKPLPILLYFHGGGWVAGNLDTDDVMCRFLAKAGACMVVSVNYRHAPEQRFPAAAEDCYAATCWVHEHAAELGGDGECIGVAGTSAGGNLAAVVTLMARDQQHPPLACQLLRVPVTNHDFTTPSYHDKGVGYGLERVSMQWFWNHYLAQSEDGNDPMASPLRATSLANLPPALVMTAEYDPLSSEGEAYAQRLQQAGVPTTYRHYAGMVHFYQGPESLADMAAHLQRYLCK